MVWYSRLLKNFQFVVIHTVKGFGIVSKADVFLELSCFLYDPADVGNLISGSSAFSKSTLYIWKFWVHEVLKPSLKDFEHNFASISWKRKWQSTPVFLPGKPHGRRSLVGYSPWSRKEDPTEQRYFHFLSFTEWRRRLLWYHTSRTCQGKPAPTS